MPQSDPTQLQTLSVQDRTDRAFSVEAPVVFRLAHLADEMPAWPSRARDLQLDRFWRTEPTLAGAIYSMSAKFAALDFKLTGPRNAVTHWRNMLLSADLGNGWVQFAFKIVQDFLCSDGGAFIEMIRPRGSTYRTPVVGIAHLDSQRCYRTGVQETPVQYVDSHGRYHDLRWHEVFPLTDMPSPREDHVGQGFSAVSRVMRAAQTLRDIGIYKRQKLSGKRVPALLFVQGLREGTVRDAIRTAQAEEQTQGRTLYNGPVLVASQDPGMALDAKLVELAGLPDGYNEDTLMKWYITTLALGFGTDYTEFAPLPGGGLGTGSQTTEMAARSRGKGPGVLLQSFEYMFNWFVLPPTMEFQFASTDPSAEAERIRLRMLRARERSLRIQSGELSPQQALQLAVEEGDAPMSFFDEAVEAEEDQIEHIVRGLSELRSDYELVHKALTSPPVPIERVPEEPDAQELASPVGFLDRILGWRRQRDG